MKEHKSLNKEQIDTLFDFFYKEIKSIAGHQLKLVDAGETISATVLANECYLKLVKFGELDHASRKDFFNYLSKSMKNFLLDEIRKKQTNKRKHQSIDINCSEIEGLPNIEIDLIELFRLIDMVEQVDATAAELLNYKMIYQMTFGEIAELMNYSERQIIRIWNQSKSLILTLISTEQ